MQIIRKLLCNAKLTNFYRKYSKRVQLNRCISLDVIGSGGLGESPSICLSISNNEKYLFNCGEDCERLLAEYGIKISAIKHIFVTQTKWNCIGGVSGVGRTINKASGWLPMLHGPEQLYKCIKRILCLSILKELDFRAIDCNSKRFFENDHVKIECVAIKPKNQKNAHDNTRDEHEVFVYTAALKVEPADADATNSMPTFRSHFMGTINEVGMTAYCVIKLMVICFVFHFQLSIYQPERIYRHFSKVNSSRP